jgi:hypothetical protein
MKAQKSYQNLQTAKITEGGCHRKYNFRKKKKVVHLCDVFGNDFESCSVVLHTELNASTSIDWVFYTLTA